MANQTPSQAGNKDKDGREPSRKSSSNQSIGNPNPNVNNPLLSGNSIKDS